MTECYSIRQDLGLTGIEMESIALHSSSTLDNSLCACSRLFDSKAMSSAKSRSVMTFLEFGESVLV